MRNMALQVLQDAARFRKARPPHYNVKVFKERTRSSSNSTRYICTVTVCNIRATGYGPSRIIAKRNSARKALELLECFKMTEVQERRWFNYAEALEDFAKKRGDRLPEYHNVPDADTSVPYASRCCYLTYDEEGYGISENLSRQDAARRVIDLLTEDGIAELHRVRI